MKGAPHGPPLAFAPELVGRCERFALRTAATLHRREGGGRAPRPGADVEYDGVRPYRAGDDPRGIDWNLLARSERVFVRTPRRQAGERWAVLLDASASMGVGEPHKLLAAAEAALGLVALGLRLGGEVLLAVAGGAPRIAPRRLSHPRSLGLAIATLTGVRAAGVGGLGAWTGAREVLAAARVFALGDLFDDEPRALLALAAARRELAVLQVLAPFEVAPDAPGAVRLEDPERDGPLELVVDGALAARYETELGRWLEGWRDACARRGARHRAAASSQPFEERLLGVLLR